MLCCATHLICPLQRLVRMQARLHERAVRLPLQSLPRDPPSPLCEWTATVSGIYFVIYASVLVILRMVHL